MPFDSYLDRERDRATKPPDNKYLRTIEKDGVKISVDVYDVLRAFAVTCPARQHAIKKLLCAGQRNKGTAAQDLTEAIAAVHRAVELAAESQS